MGRQKKLKAERKVNKLNSTQKYPSSKLIVVGTLSAAVLGYVTYYSYSNYSTSEPVQVINESQEAFVYSLENRLNVARKDYPKRQYYLNNLLQGITIPYCSGVIYDHDGSKILDYLRSEMESFGIPKKELEEEIIKFQELQVKGGYYNANTPEILQLSGMNRDSKIFIGRRIFEFEELTYLTGEDIKHIIVAHEGRHVIQHAKGLGYLDREILFDSRNKGLIERKVVYEVAELDANYYGLKRILSGEFRVSKAYFEQTKHSFLLNYSKLYSVLPKSSDIQRSFINSSFEIVKDLIP